MRTLIIAALLAFAGASALADTAKSPLVKRWEKFQANTGVGTIDAGSGCLVQMIEGFVVVDCRKKKH